MKSRFVLCFLIVATAASLRAQTPSKSGPANAAPSLPSAPLPVPGSQIPVQRPQPASAPQQTTAIPLPQPATGNAAPPPAAASPAVPRVPAQPVQTAPPAPPLAAAAPAQVSGDSVNLAFPRNSVFDVLMTYETLTGKRLIRDANLAGPEISIMVSQPVSRQEAIKLIESSLLLNGYSIVPVDDQTVKILGPSRAPRTEGLPLYIDSLALPRDGDRVVSFYKPLAFISPDEAIAVLDQVV
jgi:hypothetical protein